MSRGDDELKKLVIIGFDGTIADTSPGILYCMNMTAISMGYKPVAHDALYGVIGVSLEQGFMKLCEEMILIYDGIAEALAKLKNAGCKLALVTQKNEKFLNNMLSVYRSIGSLFDLVCATNVDVDIEKTDMLRNACSTLGIPIEDCVFIGDSYVDALAAREIGMDFAAALYGWGFRSEEDAEQYNCRAYLGKASEIYIKLSSL